MAYQTFQARGANWCASRCKARNCDWGGRTGRRYMSQRNAWNGEAQHRSWHRRRGETGRRMEPMDSVVELMERHGWKLDRWDLKCPPAPTIGRNPTPETTGAVLDFRFVAKT